MTNIRANQQLVTALQESHPEWNFNQVLDHAIKRHWEAYSAVLNLNAPIQRGDEGISSRD